MAEVDFFDPEHNAVQSEAERFYLCDRDDDTTKTPAYLTTDCEDNNLIARVENIQKTSVFFTAIDNNIKLLGKDGNQLSRFDCMLSANDGIFFVELKNRRGSEWRKRAVNQLRSTIEHFKSAHPEIEKNRREAYASNKKKPDFKTSNNSEKEDFETATGYNLLYKATIII